MKKKQTSAVSPREPMRSGKVGVEEEEGTFWRSIPTEELVKRQGGKPLKNFEELSALWPADDDPDEFDEYLARERGARRKLPLVWEVKK